ERGGRKAAPGSPASERGPMSDRGASEVAAAAPGLETSDSARGGGGRLKPLARCSGLPALPFSARGRKLKRWQAAQAFPHSPFRAGIGQPSTRAHA
ncbi:hypothetical protein IscW_ISCW021947, partial [Ixodes scapularis]